MRYSLRKTVLSIILISIYLWLRAYERELRAIRIQQANLVSTQKQKLAQTTENDVPETDPENDSTAGIEPDETSATLSQEADEVFDKNYGFLEEKIDHDKDIWWDGDEIAETEAPEEELEVEPEYDMDDFEEANTENDEGQDDGYDDEEEDDAQKEEDAENPNYDAYNNYTSYDNTTYDYDEYSTKADTDGYEDYKGIMNLDENNSEEDVEDEDYEYTDDDQKSSSENDLIDYDDWVSDEDQDGYAADADAVHIYYDTENITAKEFKENNDFQERSHAKKGLSFLEDAINQLENFENGDKKIIKTVENSDSVTNDESEVDFIGGGNREKSLQEKIDEQVDTFLDELTWEKENEINEVNRNSLGGEKNEEMVKFTDSDIQKMQVKWLNSNISTMIIVHLDFKGGNIPLNYLEKLLPSIKKWGANTLLLELEEFFPFQGDLKIETTKSGENSLKQGDVQKILKLALLNDLHVIPYINLCSDLGFLLNRNSKYHAFQTNDIDTINPGVSSSIDFTVNLMKQMVNLYKDTVSWVHIGCRLPGHYGWSMAEKSWMHSTNSGLGELYLNYLSQITGRIHKDYPKLKLIVWGNDLMKISPFSISKFNITNHIYPMFESYSKGKHLNLDEESLISTANLFPAIFTASAYKTMLRSSPDENLPSIKHYVASVNHWLDNWIELKKKGIPVIGMGLMGPNRHDHWSQLTEPFPVSILTMAACIEATKSHGWNEANKWSLERQLKIDVLPEKMYPRPMPVINATNSISN